MRAPGRHRFIAGSSASDTLIRRPSLSNDGRLPTPYGATFSQWEKESRRRPRLVRRRSAAHAVALARAMSMRLMGLQARLKWARTTRPRALTINASPRRPAIFSRRGATQPQWTRALMDCVALSGFEHWRARDLSNRRKNVIKYCTIRSWAGNVRGSQARMERFAGPAIAWRR